MTSEPTGVDVIGCDGSDHPSARHSTDAIDPDWPVGGATVVGEGSTDEIIDHRGELADPLTSLRYRVLVVDDFDGVVARGEVLTLGGP